jgi:hypothetical protein
LPSYRLTGQWPRPAAATARPKFDASRLDLRSEQQALMHRLAGAANDVRAVMLVTGGSALEIVAGRG